MWNPCRSHYLTSPTPLTTQPPTRPSAHFWLLQVQIDLDMSSPLRKMQAVVPWANSGVAVATDTEAPLVSHLLVRWARVDGEETLLGMLRGCVLERGMAKGDAVEVEGRVNASTRIAMWLKGAVVDVGLDAASVDVLCIVLDLDYAKAVSTSQLQYWRKGLLASSKYKSGQTTAPAALVLRRQD